MSEYRQVNGKKVRVCKYGCQTNLSWSDSAGIFIESDGNLHTQERCKAVKSNKRPTLQKENHEARLVRIIELIQTVLKELEGLKQ